MSKEVTALQCNLIEIDAAQKLSLAAIYEKD
jgi:hypothetical protein